MSEVEGLISFDESSSDELKLLVELCLQRKVDSLPDAFNFGLFKELLFHHRLIPDLSKSQEGISKLFVREEYLEISSEVKRSAVRQLSQAIVLRDLLLALEKEGIDVIPFKGATLSQLLYGDVTSRISKDIDLLIDFQYFDKARKTLERLGFSITGIDSSKFTGLQNFLTKGLLKHCEFVHVKSGIQVELHWSLFDNRSLPFSFDYLKRRSEKGEFLETNVTLMNREDLFIYLCVHGAEHMYFRLKWLIDIHEFLQSVNLNWQALIERAKQLDCHRSVLLSMALSRSVFGTPLPDVLDDFFKSEKEVLALHNLGLRRIINDNDVRGREANLYYFKLKVKKRDSLKIAFQRLWVRPEDWEESKLQGNWVILLVLLRPFLYLKSRLKSKN